MAMKVGDAYVEISGRLESLNAAVASAQSNIQARFGAAAHTAGIAMTAMGGAMVGAIGLGVKTAADFEQAITNAASVTGKSGAEFEAAKEKMAAMARTLGQTTVFSATEAANAFYDLSSKGFDVATMSVEQLQPILDLSAATQSDLAAATEIATGTLRGFAMSNDDLTRVADVMTASIGSSAAKIEYFGTSMPTVATAANTLGVSFEETSAVLGNLYNKSIDASTAATGMRNVMMEITTGVSKPFNEMLEKGHLTMADLNLETDGIVGTFDKFAEHGLTAQDMLAGFGKRNGVVAAAIFQTREQILGMTDALGNVGGKAHDVAELQLDTFQGKLKLLQSALQEVMIVIGNAVLPALTSFVSFMAPIISAIGSWAQRHEYLTTTIVGLAAAIGAFMLTAGPLLIMLPGIVSLVTLLSGAGGFAGLAASVVASSSAMAPFIAFLTGPGGLVLALGFLVAELLKARNAYIEMRKAQALAEESEARLIIAVERHTAKLDTMGIAYDHEKVAMMKASDAQDYLDEITRRYIENRKKGLDETMDRMSAMGYAIDRNAVHEKATYEEAKRYLDEQIKHRDKLARVVEEGGDVEKAVLDSLMPRQQLYVEALRKRGVEVDIMSLKEKDYGEQQEYLAGLWRENTKASAEQTTAAVNKILEEYQKWIGAGYTMADEQQTAIAKYAQGLAEAGYNVDEITTDIRNNLMRMTLDHRESPSINDMMIDGLMRYIMLLQEGASQTASVLDSIRNMWVSVWDSIFSYVSGGLGNLWDALSNVVGGGGGGAPGFAAGGVINSPFALVGEQGPELIMGAQGSRVINNQETAQILGGPKVSIGAVNVNVDGNRYHDPRSLAVAIEQALGDMLGEHIAATGM